MFSTAFKANPNPIRDRNPLGIVSAALEAFLTKRIVSFCLLIKFQYDEATCKCGESLRGKYSSGAYIISIFWPELSKHPSGPGAGHLQSQKDLKSCQIEGETASTWQKAVC